jgi:lauroyl/myristoyl acyltransferase
LSGILVSEIQDRHIALHVAPKARGAGYWSRDDTKFLIAAPFLFGGAVLCPETRWCQIARLIESVDDRARKIPVSPHTAAAVAGRLGICEDKLRQIITASRVNRTEHLIHVIRSLLLENWRPAVEICGRRYLDDALADRKGAVLWVAHFAFASLYTKMALSQAGYRLSHISRPEHGVSKSRFGVKYLNGFRSAAENRYLQQRIVHRRHNPEATKEAALAVLRRNELLSITVGAWEGRHFATGELLGCRYAVSTGAAAFAFAAGAKLLTVFTTRDDSAGRYKVAIGAPLGESARSSREEFVRASTQELMARYEAAIQKNPEQWRGWSSLKKSDVQT